MIRNTIGYVLGIALIGSILAFVASMLLNVLSFVAVGAVVLLPFWGAYRHRKNWTHECLGLRNWLSFGNVFKLGKRNLTSYLIIAVVVGFTYEQIAVTAGYVVGGLVSTLILWESARYVALKVGKIEMVSFSDALKSTW